MDSIKDNIESAQVIVTCNDLEPTLHFFTTRLGFRVEAIFPADAPTVAVIAAHGVRLRLQPGDAADTGTLRLLCRDPAMLASSTTESALTAPNGTRIELVAARTPLVLPALTPSFTLQRLSDDSSWNMGRAGMCYRDLIPNRQGGRAIASHIVIPEGGPVPDYVHFHKVRFQMIYCRRGWVRVVYEDQGEPFVLHAGDCVLQPPEIRHRVLESSPGLEVIELGSPAEHETHADLNLTLPTGRQRPQRDFNGQRFVRHHAAQAEYQPWRQQNFVYRDTGIHAATDGLASVHAVRPQNGAAPVRDVSPPPFMRHHGEMLFFFVLDGNVLLQLEDQEPTHLNPGDAVTLPPQMGHAFAQPSADLEVLEVMLHGEGASTTG